MSAVLDKETIVEVQVRTIERCMSLINNMRMSEAGILDDPRFAGQRGKDRSDALYDAFHTLWAVAKELKKSNPSASNPLPAPPVPANQGAGR